MSFSRDIIPKAYGRQWDEAEIQRLQKVPVFFQGEKDPGRDEDEEQSHDDAEQSSVNYGQVRSWHGPPSVKVGHWASGYQFHQPLYYGGEEEEGNGDADEGVEDTECLPYIRQRNAVAVTLQDKKKKKCRQQCHVIIGEAFHKKWWDEMQNKQSQLKARQLFKKIK